MKLLIVEDEPELQKAIKVFLEKENFICEVADSFNKADEKLEIL